MHLYFRNKEPVSLLQLQQLMTTGSLVWLHWSLGWEDKNRVRGTCRFQPDQHERGKFIGAVAWYGSLKMSLLRWPAEQGWSPWPWCRAKTTSWSRPWRPTPTQIPRPLLHPCHNASSEQRHSFGCPWVGPGPSQGTQTQPAGIRLPPAHRAPDLLHHGTMPAPAHPERQARHGGVCVAAGRHSPCPWLPMQDDDWPPTLLITHEVISAE